MKTALIVIIMNLIIGNAILYLGGKSSFANDVNFPLIMGMSIACIIIHLLFFLLFNFQIFGNVKLILFSIFSCIAIIFLGNFFALLIKEPVSEVLLNIPATIFMGLMGNIVSLPISIMLGLLNFGIITYLKTI